MIEQPAGGERAAEGAAPHLASGTPAGESLQILSTEHWSLLATRQLAYSDSFSRVGMFLSVLTGAVVSLALIVQSTRFDRSFLLIAILILSIVLFVGLVTIARLLTLNREDIRAVVAMNRVRHAYMQLHPELEPYFTAGHHDDLRGAFLTLGFQFGAAASFNWRGAVAGFQTLPGMLSVIVALVAGVIGALAAAALKAPDPLPMGIGGAVFLLFVAALAAYAARSFVGYTRSLESRFPTPAEPATPDR